MTTSLPPKFGLGNLKARKFWMSPDGDFYGIPMEWNHPMWAEEYLALNGRKSGYPQGELYDRGWVRLILGWDNYNEMVLWYELRGNLKDKMKTHIKNLAIELTSDFIEDRNGNREKVDEMITKSTLKQLIKAIILESTFKPLPREARPYKCTVCGAVQSITTNHDGPVIEYCPKCSHSPSRGESYDVPGRHKHCRAFVYDPSVNEAHLDDEDRNAVSNMSKDVMVNVYMKRYADKEFTKEELINLDKWNQNIRSNKFHIFLKNKAKEAGLDWVINEVSQKDIKSRHPQPCMPWVGADQNQPDFSKMTLDNVKAIKDKCKRTIEYVKSHPELKTRHDDLQRELTLWKVCDDEIKRRLQYINKPVTEDNKGLGYNHNVTSDARSIPSVRDELNDPRLNGKLHEQYKFDDFKWLARGDGFGVPTDVYYGTVLLGVIVSQENGYVVATVKGPKGDRSYKQDPKKPFKTKDDAAQALHRAWKSLRHGEETKSF